MCASCVSFRMEVVCKACTPNPPSTPSSQPTKRNPPPLSCLVQARLTVFFLVLRTAVFVIRNVQLRREKGAESCLW